MNFIIFNYNFSSTLKSCATLNHKILGRLGLLLFEGVGVGSHVCGLLQNTSHSSRFKSGLEEGQKFTCQKSMKLTFS